MKVLQKDVLISQTGSHVLHRFPVFFCVPARHMSPLSHHADPPRPRLQRLSVGSVQEPENVSLDPEPPSRSAARPPQQTPPQTPTILGSVSPKADQQLEAAGSDPLKEATHTKPRPPGGRLIPDPQGD